MTDCILWGGAVGGNGYGYRRWEGKTCLAHRVAYEQTKGPIPEGLTIDHVCRNRRCINPEHLEAVTLRENILRANPGQWQRDKTYCKHGHRFTAENTYSRKDGGRECIACKRASDAARYAIRKERQDAA